MSSNWRSQLLAIRSTMEREREMVSELVSSELREFFKIKDIPKTGLRKSWETT